MFNKIIYKNIISYKKIFRKLSLLHSNFQLIQYQFRHATQDAVIISDLSCKFPLRRTHRPRKNGTNSNYFRQHKPRSFSIDTQPPIITLFLHQPKSNILLFPMSLAFFRSLLWKQLLVYSTKSWNTCTMV